MTSLSTGEELTIILLILINFTHGVHTTDCPVLRSYNGNSGFLSVNKNLMKRTELIINCQWLIVGSPNQSLIVEFEYVHIPVSLSEYFHMGCHRGSVSVWTVGLKHEKIDICGDRLNIRVGGIGQMLMVELLIRDPKLDFRFMMKYRLMPTMQVPTTPATPLKYTTYRTEKYVEHRNRSTFSECGLSWSSGYKYDYISSRIVGGRQATPHSHPWQVILTNRGHFCGASLISAKWIITAAHCVYGADARDLLVEIGVHDRYRMEATRVARKITQVTIHPLYRGKLTTWIHDIALLRLSEPVTFNPFIRPVCLPLKNEIFINGEQTIVTGWGSTQGTGNYRYLREVELPIRPNELCGLKRNSWESSLCAGLCENSTCDTCQGDSGGPMVLLRNDRWHIVGLTSWGFSCSGVGVYTKVSYYADWILKIIST